MAKGKGVHRDIVIIAGLSVVTVAIWIGITVYLSLSISIVPKILQEQLRPIKPNFDTQVLNNLNLRKTISERELENLPPRALSLVKETTQKEPESTASAQLPTTPESSP